jgi:hypothetical protein
MGVGLQGQHGPIKGKKRDVPAKDGQPSTTSSTPWTDLMAWITAGDTA